MNIGLPLGAMGEAVQRLHGILRSLGLEVDAQEQAEGRFGPSTQAAVQALQSERGLPAHGEIDHETLNLLVELEQRLTININEAPAPGPTPPRPVDNDCGTVHGHLVDGDGMPLVRQTVVLQSVLLRNATRLAEGSTDHTGAFRLSYRREQPLNLHLQALDAQGRVIATSAVAFAAAADLALDLSTAGAGVVPHPSAFATLNAALSRPLGDVPLQSLKQDKEHDELGFVASASDQTFASVARLYIARRLTLQSPLDERTFFGLFSQGVPVSLEAALGDLPDAGIDDTFVAQVQSGLLAHSRAALDAALTAALAANVLPASYALLQPAQLDALDALRVQTVGATPYVRGKTPLSALLGTAQVDATVASAFTTVYAAAGGRLGPTWKALRADKSLTKAQLTQLKTSLSAGELLGGNLPLVGDTLQRLAAGSLRSLQDLALMDEPAWAQLIAAVDPGAESVPLVLPNDTPQQRIDRLAKALAQRFASRFPTTAVLGGLGRATNSSFSAKDELVQVLTQNPTLNLARTSIDKFVAKASLTLSNAALDQLKTLQRLHRLSPHYATVEALHTAGFTSAQAIYFHGQGPFVAQVTPLLGSAPLAKAAWLRARATYASTLSAFGRYNLALNSINFQVLASAVPPQDALANLPDLQALFGSLDYCECSDCRSIVSPGAYLVDLLQFLKQRSAGGGFANAREVLLARRPDLQYIALGCENTDTTLPYIDVVNELLESAIAPPALPVTLIQTTGSSDERRALPQQVSQDAYALTAGAVFPLGLPFDLPFAQTRSFMGALGTSLSACMSLCQSGSAGARAATQLGLNPAMQAVVNGSGAHAAWQRWGFTSANPVDVIDPKTRQTFTPADWVAALSRVSVVLARSGLDLNGLYQLLDVRWVTKGAVSLNPGFKGEGDLQVVSCDTEAMTFTGLDADVLDRASRFLRLQAACGLAMWDLDQALTQATGGALDDAFLVLLADALTVRDRLGIDWSSLLSFWGPMATQDGVNHLGDTDLPLPATYSQVFRSPTLLASWGGVFVNAAALPATPIVVPAEPPPTAAQTTNLNAIKAALGLSADDIQAILSASGAANALTLDTLNVLLRHAQLASALSMSVPDLLAWMVLVDDGGGRPFGGAPADTLEFLRRLGLLQATGIALPDLDNALRASSGARSAFTFTTPQVTAVLQAVRDALAKLAPAAQADAPTVQAIVVDALATATASTANVVTPLLQTSGALPLPSATITLLLSQTSGIDPTLFPTLVSAFLQVSKGTALRAALLPTESEFAFLIAQAASFQWLNPAALPLITPAVSPYRAFERLLQALQLQRLQPARSPKLFDVLAGWLAALPPDVTTAVNGQGGALALALVGSAPDAVQLAGALSIGAPALGAGLPGSLADVAALARIAQALAAQTRYRISASTLLQLAASPPTVASATTAMGVFQAQYTPAAWFAAVTPIEDALRSARRDALVGYLLGQGPATPVSPPMLTTDDLFDRYLIDPEMCPCGITTRLLEASLAVQQFVLQCFLNLVPAVTVDRNSDSGWDQWSWMKQFRLWQANREVFLYPENYLLPELRTDKSPFFVDLENDLKQSNCDAEAADVAFQNYLRKLVEVSNLVVSAHYNEIRPDGTRTLHVFARTRATPTKWFYRTRDEGLMGAGLWNPWKPLNLDIQSDHLMPVVWDQHLHLVWASFKQLSQKAQDQDVPKSPGGGSTSTAQKMWSVEFALSELSAGQWQAKRTVAEKLYFLLGDDSPLSYTFRAFQDAAYNLQLQVWIHGRPQYAVPVLLATASLAAPDAPLVGVEDPWVLPKYSDNLIDITQEPSFLLLNAKDFTHPMQQLAMPYGYGFRAQDLVWGNYVRSNAGNVPLYVLEAINHKTGPSSLELLQTILNPHIVVPQQEPVFDSADPFFVSEPSRTFFVQPHYYTISSSPQEFDILTYVSQWSTRYAFAPFYHPFARTMLRELEIGGTDRLMQRNLQLNPIAVRNTVGFDFASLYQPQPPVATPYPVEAIEFTADSAYASYNWEVFYHAPMFVASQLMRNQQYDSAMHWLEYIFNPTDPSPAPVPGHFWNMAPFYAMNASDWLAQQIQTILTTLAADAQLGISDPAAAAALADWLAHPFDPHRVARLRIGAYAKATVMKFLDNLIAWGDSLYAQYTMENVAQAEQLYVFADLILGPPPDQVRLPAADQPSNPDATTYAQIAATLDQFSNTLVAIENVISAPSTSLSDGDPQALQGPSLPQVVTGTGETLFFCIPPNDQMLAYWATVADRLYKIRHCLNQQGVAQPLPLYAPPINPLQLIAQAASGSTSFGNPPFTPVYRFATYLERALDLTNDVRAYGAEVLAALEKKDSEALGVLRANQDVDIQQRMIDLKNQAITEAQDQITVLRRQQDMVHLRQTFYSTIAFMNDWEIAAIALQGGALIANGVAVILDMTSGAAHLVPTVSGGAAGFGGSPMITTSYGGEQVGSSATSWASVARGLAGLLGEAGAMASTMGSYQRRQDDWTLQANLASAELVQIAAQMVTAGDRLKIAQGEVDLQQRQAANAQAVGDFLGSKYTNSQLYDWMLTQLTTVHTQAYQLAYGLSLQAQAAYQYELGSTDTFMQFGYWDGQHKGLTAGDSLLFDLRRMHNQFTASNTRELELTKHVSLALTQPMALVQLLQTGTCTIALDEVLFDRDHPGHYFRRLRSVAVTVPCVTGPYTGVNATLSLNTGTVRVKPPIAPYKPAAAGAPPASADFVASVAPSSATIATSSAQNDAGLFDANLHDERWLPFEGQGAISTWTLQLDPRDNAFDLSTVTDVVLHVRYTARSAGGDAEAVRSGIRPVGPRQILLSVRNSFGSAYYQFFKPSDSTATQQDLVLPVLANVLPFSNLGTASLTDIGVYFALTSAPAPGTSIAANFGPSAGAVAAMSLVPVPGTTGAGTAISAIGADAGLAAPVTPQSFTLSVPEASVPAALAVTVNGHQRLDPNRFEDIVLVLSYRVA